jgi:hypothetical protein
MILKVDNIQMKLIQVSSRNLFVDDINPKGLYLVPNKVEINDFEEEAEKFEEQDEFDENNSIGAQRIYAYDSVVEINW